MWGSVLDWGGSEYGPMTGFCEYCDELSGSIKAWNFVTNWISMKTLYRWVCVSLLYQIHLSFLKYTKRPPGLFTSRRCDLVPSTRVQDLVWSPTQPVGDFSCSRNGTSLKRQQFQNNTLGWPNGPAKLQQNWECRVLKTVLVRSPWF
jgi:hypothetical protein